MRTLNGYAVNKLPELLDQPLPPSAYKKIPGGANLTDVSAAWQRRVFNKIFGVCGLGWGFEFEAKDLDLRAEEAKSGNRTEALAKVYGQFWFLFLDKEGKAQRGGFPVTGANTAVMGQEAYAMKGAITNAIGFGASMLGWQESVYMGARSHDNTEGFADGKGYCDILPEHEIEPTAEPKEDPRPLVILPPTPSAKTKAAPKQTAKAAAMTAAETKPTTPAELPPEIEKPETKPDADKSLAEQCGMQSIKHVVCLQCGYAEPVNALPEACPRCGVVAFEAFSVLPGHAEMLKCSANVKAKLDIKASAESSMKTLEEIKRLCSNNRLLILQSLTRAAGRDIKNYSEATPEEMQVCLRQLPSVPCDGTKIGGEPAKFADKAAICTELFAVGRALNLGTPRQIIAEIGRIAGKEITSSTQLDENSLLQVLADFNKRKPA